MEEKNRAILAQSRTFAVSSLTGKLEEIAPPVIASPGPQLLGTVIDDKYKLLQLLGEGGMGAVYRARHLLLDKDIAFKTFRSSDTDPYSVERFVREVRAVAKLESKNVVQV